MLQAEALLHFVVDGLACAAQAAAIVGVIYLVAATTVVARFFRRREAAPPRRDDAVTLLKPLCGDEPRLRRNLGSFVDQTHGGPLQLVCGVARPDDAALVAVRGLREDFPDAAIELVVSPVRHGASGKVSNLVNMDARAAHPVVILSDSDMAVDREYVSRILAALDAPDVGAVSLLYAGRGDAGFWSVLGAAGLSYQFLPGAVFGVATAIVAPCMGSTIAIRRATLDRIGGLRRFADELADDYALGEAVRRIGLRIAVPPIVIDHACAERGFAELWCHEIRWARTVRSVVPLAFAASVVSMPLPLAALGCAASPSVFGLALVVAASAMRMLQVRVVDRSVGRRSAPLWMLPLRDALSFAVFLASYFGRTVDWRGARHRVAACSRVAANRESHARRARRPATARPLSHEPRRAGGLGPRPTVPFDGVIGRPRSVARASRSRGDPVGRVERSEERCDERADRDHEADPVVDADRGTGMSAGSSVRTVHSS